MRMLYIYIISLFIQYLTNNRIYIKLKVWILDIIFWFTDFYIIKNTS